MGELSAVLRATDIRRSYGGRRILDVSFEAEAGDFWLISGENGAGKTTFLRCLLGLDPHRGDLSLNGHSVRGKIVGVLEQPVLYPGWRVSTNLRYLLNDSAITSLPVVRELLPDALLHARARSLSTGQTKLVLLAAALASTAQVVLMDEFASGLDRVVRDRVRDVLRRERDLGERIFIATGHDRDVFEELPTRRGVLENGAICEIADFS